MKEEKGVEKIQYLDSTQHVRPKFFQRTGEKKRSEPMIPIIALGACEELVDCLDVIHKCNDAACKHKHNDTKDAYAVEADECMITKVNDFEQVERKMLKCEEGINDDSHEMVWLYLKSGQVTLKKTAGTPSMSEPSMRHHFHTKYRSEPSCQW